MRVLMIRKLVINIRPKTDALYNYYIHIYIRVHTNFNKKKRNTFVIICLHGISTIAGTEFINALIQPTHQFSFLNSHPLFVSISSNCIWTPFSFFFHPLYMMNTPHQFRPYDCKQCRKIPIHCYYCWVYFHHLSIKTKCSYVLHNM